MAHHRLGTAWRCLLVATMCIALRIQVNAVTRKAAIKDRTSTGPTKGNDMFRSLERTSMRIAAKNNSRPLGNGNQESTTETISRRLTEVQETSSVHHLGEFSVSVVDSRSNGRTDGGNEDRRSEPSTISSRFESPSELRSETYIHEEEANMVSEKRSLDREIHLPPKDDPWQAYDIISGSNVVESWEVLRQAELIFYSFKYEKRLGRRRLGILPTEVPKLMPEAFSTVTMPILLPDGSRSSVEDVPNVDWSRLFSHTFVVTQELSKRFDELAKIMDAMKVESQNASLKLVRLTEALGGEWQSSTQLRDFVEIEELIRDITQSKITFEKVAGRERRRLVELRHTKDLELMEMELNVSKTLAKEKLSLAKETLLVEEIGVKDLEITEETFRRSSEKALFLLDMEAASQSARLSANRRLAESLATIQEMAAAERGTENARTTMIRARGEAARGQTQTIIDETFALLGTMVLSAVSDPGQLAKILAGFFCITFVSLLVGNSVTLAARAIRRRMTKPQLVREMDLSGTFPAVALDWVRRNSKALPLSRVGRRSRCRQNLVPPRAFEGVILPPGIEHRLCSLASSIRASCARGAPLPHVLLHGAPGSGKSLIAKQLARTCGLNTVIVSGGDVGPLGATASSELGGIFRWTAGMAQRGAAVAFIMDEAEAALGDRRRAGMSENARSALNAILLHTGEARPGFMVVLTTSRPQDIDEAMLDRVDEVIHLPAPTLAERKQLAGQYFSTYLRRDAPPDLMEAEDSVNNGIDTNNNTSEGDMIHDERTPLSSTAGVSPEQDGRYYSKESDPSNPIHRSENDVVNNGSKSAQSRVERPTRADRTRLTSGCDDLASGRWVSSFLGIGQSTAHCQQRRPRSYLGSAPTNSTSEKSKRTTRACNAGGSAVRLSEDFSSKAGELLKMLAVRSEGFHGRDMARFFSAIQAAVYSSEACTLTQDLWVATEKQKLREFSARALMIATASASHATVAGVPSKGNLSGPFVCATLIEDEAGGERKTGVLLKSASLGVTSTDKKARERPRSEDNDLRVVSKRHGLDDGPPTMAQVTMDVHGATESSITDSSSTDSVSSALGNGVSAASPALVFAEYCGLSVSGGRLLKPSEPEVTRPEERDLSFSATSSATSSHKRKKKPRKKKKRSRKASSHEIGGGALKSARRRVPLAGEKAPSFEQGALQEMRFGDDSIALSRHGAACFYSWKTVAGLGALLGLY